MRWSVAVALSLVARAASADPVDLLRSAPSVVAVSSSVANGDIKPEHLVDGDLKTAWNSRTDELVGSWIAFRVAAGAHVTAIKMTAGFTRNDKGGDLFTMNPRITHVRVSRHDKVVADFALDPENRDLQTLALDQPGGDFAIEVQQILPGSKPGWRETCVSELQVWGTLPATQAVVASKPVVRVGGLDVLATPSFDDCRRLLFPAARGGRTGPDDSDDWLTDWAALGVGRELAVCRVEHNAPGSPDISAELVVVRRVKGAWAIAGVPRTETFSRGEAGMSSVDGSAAMTLFPLTTTENAVLFDVRQSRSGPMQQDVHRTMRLDRITATGFVQLVAFESSDAGGESHDADVCTLAPLDHVKPLFQALDLACVHTIGRYHGEDPRGNGDYSTESKRHFRWNATTQSYVELTPPAP